MKKPELEQLANRLIEIANDLKKVDKPEDFWRKSNKMPIYIHKSGIGFDSVKQFRPNLKNNTAITSPVTDFTELSCDLLSKCIFDLLIKTRFVRNLHT